MRKPAVKDTAAITLEIRVQPRAGRRALWLVADGSVKAALQSPPEGGKANNELVRLVASTLGIARSDVEVWRGHKSRQKVLRIWGMVSQDLSDALNKLEVK